MISSSQIINSTQFLVDLNASKVDDFSSVDAGSHLVTQSTSAGSTSSTDAYKAGDIVKADDGTFFRATKDRTEPGAENWSNYDTSTGLSNAISANGWAGNIPSFMLLKWANLRTLQCVQCK